ncbi:MAG: DUF4012 domain-containing protein [Chloroflexi bacterium]|nr:DUF4012 domain-containing protein [Chloroflexota bacterium]
MDNSSLSNALTQHRRRRRRRGPVARLKRQLRRFNYTIIVVVFVSVAAFLVMGTLLLTISTRNQVEDSQDNLERVLSDVSRKPGADLTLADFDRLQASVRDLNNTITNAQRLTRFLRPFAFLNAEWETYFEALDVAQELALSANDMLAGIEPTLRYLSEGTEDERVELQLSSAERSVELLRLGQGRFLNARNRLQTAQGKIDDFRLAEVSPNLLVTVDRLIRYHRDLQDINDLLLDAPELLTVALGLETPQTYLVLSQNSDELRPSGGYISTYGWIDVQNGRIAGYDYAAATAESPNPPPASLAAAVDVPDWWFSYPQPLYAAWDGSWHADFPSTAEMAAWYYNSGDNFQAPVDGVIAIDMVGFGYLLEGLESVSVPGYDLVVTPDNFRELVYEIRASNVAGEESPHKAFLAALYKQILTDWQQPETDSLVMRQAMFRALQEKHIMIYFVGDRAHLNAAVDQLGWSGHQKSGTERDYLMVADANQGSKSNRSVVRQLVYDVEIMPDGTLDSRVTVDYDFPQYLAEADPAVQPAHYSTLNYHNLLQVFVPANSTLTGQDNLRFDPQIVRMESHTDFVARVRVDFNSSTRIQLAYTTPELVESFGPYRRYELLIQKQPGTQNELASVQLRLPPGADVIHTSPAVAASYTLDQPVLEFQLEMFEDQSIVVLYTD